jgi:nucleoside-diphosphate-sugar epimerase
MKILITGSSGMVGRHLVTALQENTNLTLLTPSHAELNLLEKNAVDSYLSKHHPDFIIHLAAKVGGIQANINEPVEFLVENTLMGTHVIAGALKAKVPQLLNIGSACMYPKDKEVLRESDLLSDRLEPTNEAYAISKINSTLLCHMIQKQYGLDYKTIIPTNLYGPYDHFDPVSSHLIPAVIMKLHAAKIAKAKEVVIWGDGEATRDFMYVGDLIRFITNAFDRMSDLPSWINLGVGKDYSVNEYYNAAAKVIGYQGTFIHDLSKPSGMRRKLMDVSLARDWGWEALVSMNEGLMKTYDYYRHLEKHNYLKDDICN